MAGWEQRPCPPTSTAFLKWGERESEADVTACQGALLHRRGFSWERRFGGLAGARAGKTKDHKWERNSEGPCLTVSANPEDLAIIYPSTVSLLGAYCMHSMLCLSAF